MKTGWKIAAGVAAFTVGTVGIGIAYVASFDPNANKAMITDKFREATGRELALDGEIGLTLFPWLGVTLNDISISNAPGFSNDPMLKAGHAQVRVKLLPLLDGEYEIDTIVLDGVQLRLEVAGNGATNWADLGGGAAADSATPAKTSSSAGFNKLILGGVDIKNTSLVYDDQSANTHYELNDLNLQIGALVYGEPLNVQMSLRAASRAPQLNADVKLTGTVLYDLDNGVYQLDPVELAATLSGPTVPGNSATLGLKTALRVNTDDDTLSLPNLAFDALGTTISGDLNVTDLQSDAPSLQANLVAMGDDLGALFRVLDQNELANRIRTLDSKFNVNVSVNADMQSGEVKVPTLQASLLGATLIGNLNATGANTDEPVVSGNLEAQGPDLPTLIEVVGILQGGRDTALAQTGRDLGRVRNKRFSLSGDFTADMGEGNIDLPALKASLLGFTLDGQLKAQDINGGGGAIDGKLALQSETVGDVLAALGQGGVAEIARSLKLDVQLGGDGDTLRISPLNLSLVVAGAQLGNTPQTLALNADTEVDLAGDSLNVDAFTLSGLGLNLNGRFAAEKLSSALSYVGELTLPAFNARDFMAKLNLEAPETADASVLRNVALNAEFSGGETRFDLSEFTLKLDDTTIAGNVKLDDLATQRGNFAVTIDAINADRYLAPPNNTQATAGSSEASPLPTEALRNLNLQGELKLGQLTISGLQMSDIVVPLKSGAGVVTLNPVSAKLYGGSFTGDLGLDVSGPEGVARVATNLVTVDLGALTRDFLQADYLSGIGNVQLALEGRGNDSTALKRALNGSGALALTDGVFKGVDVGATLNTLEAMIRSKRLVDLPQGGSTTFENFSATLAVQNGVVQSNDLLIKAPGWQVTGSGTLADLQRDTLAFNLTAATDASTATVAEQQYDIGGHQLPIACTGALNSPRCLPDAKAIIAAAVTNAVQDRIGNFLRDRLGGTQEPAATDAAAAPANASEAPAETPPASDGTQAPAEQPAPPPEEQLINRAIDLLRRR